MVLQCAAATRLPHGHFRFLPVDHLDRPGHVARVRIFRSRRCDNSRWPPIRAHHSLFRHRISADLPGGSRDDDYSRRISQPHARHALRAGRGSKPGYDDPDAGARMSKLTRRQMIGTGLAAAAGVSGLAVAAKLAHRYGLVPPDSGGPYGPGATLTYAAQRIMTRHTLAREFSRSQISAEPFAYPVDPLGDEFQRLQNAAFIDWRLAVDGLVERPGSFSLEELKSYPAS